MKSRYITTICWALRIDLHLTYCPEHKPHVERFFGTLNTRLWSNQPGYTGSSVAERSPTAEQDAELAIAQLEEKFWEFINEEYHKEAHSSLKVSPTVFWDENCYTEAANSRDLDVLLMEPEHRRVSKGRISLDGRDYFHPELAIYAGEDVLVRRSAHYAPPDTIEVYKRDEWLCTAVALDSELADNITANDVHAAQRAQRQAARNQIAKAKETLVEDDRQSASIPQITKLQLIEGNMSPESNSAEIDHDAHAQQPSLPAAKPIPTPKESGSFLRGLGRQAKNSQEGKINE